MNCIVCETQLSGSLDTFGPVGQEMCWDCWKLAGDEPEWAMVDAVYGLGPHVHTFDADGNIIIGGTVFLDTPEPGPDGLIQFDGGYFMPDAEAPGLGVWFRDREAARKFTMLKEGLE